MARLPRAYVSGVVQHLVQRAAAGRTLFVTSDDYAHASDLLADASRQHGLAIHAYVLLPEEIRLLATPGAPETTSRVFQALGRSLAPRFNRRDERTGALWRRRYRSVLVDAEVHLLPLMRYVEQRPVALHAAGSPLDWHWSSARHHVGNHQNVVVNDHSGYWALSDTPFGRQAAYRSWLADETSTDDARRFEQAVETGWPLLSEAQWRRSAECTGRRMSPRRQGRPRKIALSPINIDDPFDANKRGQAP